MTGFGIKSRQPLDPAELARSLSEWYGTPAGQRMADLQTGLCRRAMPSLPGFRALLLSPCDSVPLLNEAQQLHRFALAPSADAGAAALADYDALPLPSRIVDVALVHHVLDYCPLPHEALNEVARVIAPGGHMVVMGYNPFGWAGALRLISAVRPGDRRWQCRCLRAGRVADWLRLLGFQCRSLQFGGWAPPLQWRRFQAAANRLDGLGARVGVPWGTFYMIVAQKLERKPVGRRAPAWLPKAVTPAALGRMRAADLRRPTVENH